MGQSVRNLSQLISGWSIERHPASRLRACPELFTTSCLECHRCLKSSISYMKLTIFYPKSDLYPQPSNQYFVVCLLNISQIHSLLCCHQPSLICQYLHSHPVAFQASLFFYIVVILSRLNSLKASSYSVHTACISRFLPLPPVSSPAFPPVYTGLLSVPQIKSFLSMALHELLLQLLLTRAPALSLNVSSTLSQGCFSGLPR